MCISSLLQFKFINVKHDPARLFAPIGQKTAHFQLGSWRNPFEHLCLLAYRYTFQFDCNVTWLARLSLRRAVFNLQR